MYSKNINLPATLLLADGTYYSGISIGKIGSTAGEICFNTGMTGYQKFSQILVISVKYYCKPTSTLVIMAQPSRKKNLQASK